METILDVTYSILAKRSHKRGRCIDLSTSCVKTTGKIPRSGQYGAHGIILKSAAISTIFSDPGEDGKCTQSSNHLDKRKAHSFLHRGFRNSYMLNQSSLLRSVEEGSGPSLPFDNQCQTKGVKEANISTTRNWWLGWLATTFLLQEESKLLKEQLFHPSKALLYQLPKRDTRILPAYCLNGLFLCPHLWGHKVLKLSQPVHILKQHSNRGEGYGIRTWPNPHGK